MEPKPEPESAPDEEEDASVEEIVVEEETGWDGWKDLLKEKSLPKGVKLPPPNPDPSYIPTPPKPALA